MAVIARCKTGLGLAPRAKYLFIARLERSRNHCGPISIAVFLEKTTKRLVRFGLHYCEIA
jgi:hypothetical protein